jgi:hypothetical protein
MRKQLSSLFLKVFGLSVVISFLWFLRPNQTMPPKIDTIVKNPEEAPLIMKPQEPKINLMLEHPSSHSAEEEMLKGRFILNTSIVKNSTKSEVYRQMLLRQGILISLDRQGNYFYLSRKERIPLDVQSHQVPNLKHYALHRPRKINPVDFDHLTAETLPGDELFLVMPNNFETGVFTMIERILPNPLTEYSKANLFLGLSKANHLSFILTEVFTKDGKPQILNRSLKGL